MVLYPNKLPESERVCSGICTEELLKHIRAVYFFRNEITAFIPEKGGEK